MDKKQIRVIVGAFDGAMGMTEENIEFWYARDLMGILVKL